MQANGPYSLYYISEFSGEDFYLVNSVGERTDEGDGLLIYKGGTVCDDSFSTISANAICMAMGHITSISWTYGELFSIQSNYNITLDDVQCSSHDLSSCSYNVTTDDCSHSQDVHLTCYLGT